MRRRESQVLYRCITNIDSKYIEEAEQTMDQKSNRGSNTGWNKYVLPVASVLLILICATALFTIRKPFDKNLSKKPLSVSAAELREKEIQLGATMPDFLYADSDRVVMYDYAGIWEYNLNKKRLSGFCDFRPIGMTRIQGDPYVVVEMSADGTKVRFYWSDGTKKYLYDVSGNECFQVEDYDTSWENLFQMKDVTAEKSLSKYSRTYQMENGGYISYVLDGEYEEGVPKYGDIRLIVEEDGETEYYAVFQ